jgi:general secretion pathway protein D
MKTTILVLLLFLTGLELRAQMPLPPQQTNAAAIRQRVQQLRQRAVTNTPAATAPPAAVPTVNGIGTPSAPPVAPQVPAGLPASPAPDPSSPSAPASSAPAEIPAYTYNLQGVDVNQVLDLYADLVGRTLLRAVLPQASIVLKTQTALTKTEAIQALQAVLALNNISLVNVGDKFVKVVQSDQANLQAAAFDHTDATNLPDLGSYVTHIVQLKYVKPGDMVQFIQPFARLQNSIFPIDSNGILVLRDYAENVKRMLEMIAQIDVSVPAEYISEVIPIRYAQAEDIANALNTLGGSGGSTVSFGGSGAGPSINGLANRPTTGGISGLNNSYQSGGVNGQTQPRPVGTPATANGTPATGTTFQQRLQSIINKASAPGGGQPDQIQVFGQTKIIADERSNSLLVFATRSDMDNIKRVINQLDVLLAQVLIESVIIDVSLNKALNIGVSAAQNPKLFSGNSSTGIAGGGGSITGTQPSFLNFLNGAATNATTLGTNTTANFGKALGSGLSYFGNIGPTWDVALQAAANDSSATVIQRPRIQTSQAKPASFFVGQTVPYVTGSTYGSAYGNSSSYSQLSVGVELDVTPFINPDGLVVMDINQEIDDISSFTTIDGNPVPNTSKRTLSSELAVKDRDTVMLGGFVRSDKSKSKAGVPFLQDIPLLGALFTQRNDKKDRDETIVMIRPTVLKTPELAAAQTIKEQQRLPGIIHAEADDDADAQKQIEADRRADLKARKNRNAGGLTPPPPAVSAQPQSQDNGFFYAPPTDASAGTNNIAPQNP